MAAIDNAFAEPHTVLVTGAGGFIGTRLCELLRDRGFSVKEITRSHIKISSDRQIVSVGEIGSSTNWSAALQGVTSIVHLAARAHVTREQTKNPIPIYRHINVGGTLQLAESAIRAGVKRFVYVSSIKVNGEYTTDVPFTEVDIPDPKDAYGISKWEAEKSLWSVSKDTGMEVVVVRPPLVYGPGVKGNFLSLMRMIRLGVPLPLAGCKNRRRLVSLDNLVDLLIHCVSDANASGRTFLAGDDEDMSTSELVVRLAHALGTRARLFSVSPAYIQYIARALGKTGIYDRLYRSMQLDINGTTQALSWAPPSTIDEELERTAKWFLQTRNC